jgi:cellulose synthase/poly-beta-1,6-N-acetylglucosamine synthase-like glycosyltransferase
LIQKNIHIHLLMYPLEMGLHIGLFTFVIAFCRKTTPLINYVPKRKSPEKIAISIIIPIYNEEENLEKLLSTLYSCLHDVEIIFVNDSSTDKSLSLLEQYKEMYKYKVINIEKQTIVADVLNEGLKQVSLQSNYVGVFNGDCHIDKNWYEKISTFLKNYDVSCLKLANYSKLTTINSFPQYLAFLEKNYKRYMFTYEEAFLSNGYFVEKKYLQEWKTITEDMNLSLQLKTRGVKIYQHPHIHIYDSLPKTWNHYLKQKYRWMYGDIVNRCLFPPQNIFGLLVNAYYFFPCLLLLTAFQFNILNRIQLSILFTETLMHYQSNSRTNIFISFIYSFSQYLFAQFFYITLPFKKVTW